MHVARPDVDRDGGALGMPGGAGAAASAQDAAARMPWIAAACFSIALLALFHETAWSMVAIWLRSDTFAHGFLILPISAWLAWRDRAALAAIPARSAPWVVVLVLGAGGAWLLASLLDVLVVEQLALVAMLITGIWAILGTALTRRLAFPLGFLFLAVPMGLSLEDPMMDLTADWTVRLIRATGIPVYQEDRFFQLPTGSWSVVEACSGVRYIIASFTLGLIYAYITYRSPWRRLAFIAASLAAPVVANVLRAWGIVMIGHFSGMKYATGVDHLIYGWVFFGVVMLLLFWVGGFWQEDMRDATAESGPAEADRSGAASSGRAIVLTTLVAFAGAATAPALGSIMANVPTLTATAPLAPPAAAGWRVEDLPGETWSPVDRGADRVLDTLYTRNGAEVALHLRQYLDQRQGEELVAHGDPWDAGDKGWRVIGRGRAEGYPAAEVTLSHARSGERLLAWTWYWIDGRATPSDYVAKLLEARLQLRFEPRRGARIYVATPVERDVDAARARLLAFVQAQEAALAAALDEAVTEAAPGP